MKTLFAISVIALLALLWASISMVQHVRRIRRKRRQTAVEKLSPAVRAAPPPVPYANPASEQDVPVNHDLGNLSDPYEQRRTRPKDRASL